MGYLSIITSFLPDIFKGNYTKVIIAVLTAVIIGFGYYYISSLKEERNEALSAINSITKEFNDLYDADERLKKDFKEKEAYYKHSIDVLNKKHDNEMKRLKVSLSIKRKVENVKDEDDGDVAPILNDVLDSLRMYK